MQHRHKSCHRYLFFYCGVTLSLALCSLSLWVSLTAMPAHMLLVQNSTCVEIGTTTDLLVSLPSACSEQHILQPLAPPVTTLHAIAQTSMPLQHNPLALFACRPMEQCRCRC